MKKCKKWIFSICLTMALLTSVPSFASAGEADIDKSKIQATNENASQIIASYGYEESQYKFLSEEDRLVIAKALLINPSLVKSQKKIVHFDELGLLEKFVNSSEQELALLGMNSDEIAETRVRINEILLMENLEVMSKYNKSAMEVKLLKEAITPQTEYYAKPLEGNVVTSSGNAGDSDLQVDNWVTDISGSDCGAVAYKVTNSFEWLNGFVWYGTDEMITCWGGGLNSKGETGIASYANGFPATNSTTTSQTLAAPREQANLSQTFRIPTKYNGNHLYAGSTSMTIYQDTIKNGYSTKVLTEYGHQYISVSNVGFTVGVSGSGPSAAVSISVGKGFWRSGQAKEFITT